jgi:hypothetical protein
MPRLDQFSFHLCHLTPYIREFKLHLVSRIDDFLMQDDPGRSQVSLRR